MDQYFWEISSTIKEKGKDFTYFNLRIFTLEIGKTIVFMGKGLMYLDQDNHIKDT